MVNNKRIKRGLAQMKRDLIGDLKYISIQVKEALGFIDQLEKKFSKRVGRQLLVRLRRLGGIDEDLMEMMLDKDPPENDQY